MYPQSIAADAETLGGRLAPVPIQVGFPGMASSYQRRLGPDGELSSDIIGPDGHTEELPPYTRYPDEAYVRKVRDAEEQERQQQRHLHQAQPDGVAVVGASIEPPPVVRMIPGAGGIGLATRNPEFGSTDDLGSPTSRHSSRSFTSASDNSQQEINSPRGTMTEKDAAGRWKGKSRRRICGLPVWVLGCAIMFVIVLGVVLGTVVGTFLAKRKPPSFRREDDS